MAIFHVGGLARLCFTVWVSTLVEQFDIHQIAYTRGYNAMLGFFLVSQYYDREGPLKLKNGQKQPFFPFFEKNITFWAISFR